ncbi:family 43 glycosylhydrolase [Streptomyces sp. NBC_01754]|uniref:glycoside hydrolase family 32 protein n=1 Tax=Streptomyces sp. NBC_01754 TaxID=2975930 RepID=UPI002DDC709F|nr:glycoside hydrolase family 32 protein [Streptomyces sp. NBC_01754]WSC96365.1 family 43 glycosylhydrolase [Streptomyces sp. NBC_01754]
MFFKPSDGWVGDVIPFERDGVLHLFYLWERREVPKPGTPWSLASTRDLLHVEERGIALPHGSAADADFNAYTGCVVVDEAGVHHLFYTGQNPAIRGEDGRPLQVVMHATSTDALTSWTKHPEHTFGAPEGYETGDWRDPFVFFDERRGVWRMLIAARHREGPDRRRGVIAQCESSDLQSWKPVEPFWDPRRYITHECPEVFRLGDWWYLVYSEFSESFTTRYRMAKGPDGPWQVPERDTIDGRAFYAAKSAEFGGRRIFAGWIAGKEGGTDEGAWQWAGTMSFLEAVQNEDGTLAFSVPAEILAAFDEEAATGPAPVTLTSADGFACTVGNEPLPDRCSVRAEFDIAPGTTECGLLLRTSEDGDQGYVVRLEPGRSRMVLDRWPRTRTGGEQWQISGDVPYAIELERPADLRGRRHTLDVVIEQDLAVVVLDGQVCLSTRLYDTSHDRLGFFVGEGSAELVDLRVRVRTTTE